MESWYGVTQTRQVYEKAIKDLNEEGAREVSESERCESERRRERERGCVCERVEARKRERE